MEAMTSEYGSRLAESLLLLNYIIDNPVSLEDTLKTKTNVNEPTADEIKIALDKKRKQQIHEVRDSFIGKKLN